jgi:uncharacterized protein YwqG
METKDIVKQLQPWIDKHKRSTWKPVTKAGDGEIMASKFSGMPWISEDDSWPVCKVCQQPLQLFLQLDLGLLPSSLEEDFGTGLLQLFYCVGDRNGSCDFYGGWEPFSNNSCLVRIVQPYGAPLKSTIPQSDSYFPAKTIVGWEGIPDLPSPIEQEELGLRYTYDFDASTTKLECSELDLVFEDVHDEYLAENISMSRGGDKLAGWPHWVQHVEYPYCPLCGERMRYLFQIDSEDNLPYMFGDVGTGHIIQCAQHKEIVAFGWACS